MVIQPADVILMLSMLVLSAFFSGIEIAFISANKLKIELKSKQEDGRARIVSGFFKKTSRIITTILVGNNLALVIYGLSIGKLLAYFFWAYLNIHPERDITESLLLQTAISTLIILIFGEYLPKAIFRLNPDSLLLFFSRLLRFFYYLFWPIVSLISMLSRFMLKKVFRVELEEEDTGFGKRDLNLYMQETLSDSDNGSGPEIDPELFSNAMEFNETRVRDFMIPRTEIKSLSLDSDLKELMETFIETEKSKIIIYDGSMDQVVGYVHHLSMFTKPLDIRSVLQPLIMVPESMPANILLDEFNKNRKTVAIVVDEFGGTEGMVTIEDLVEEVFGEIVDEHDDPIEDELLEKQLDENSWLFSARLEVDDINKDHNLNLPEGDYNTLSGLVMYHAETIPAVNDVIDLDAYRITVLDASQNKVDAVKVERVDKRD